LIFILCTNKQQTTMNTQVRINNLSPQQSAQLLDAIDWGKLIPAAIDLVKLATSGQLFTDLQRTVALIKEIIDALVAAEQSTNLSFDWEQLLRIILDILLPIFMGKNVPASASASAPPSAQFNWSQIIELLIGILLPIILKQRQATH